VVLSWKLCSEPEKDSSFQILCIWRPLPDTWRNCNTSRQLDGNLSMTYSFNLKLSTALHHLYKYLTYLRLCSTHFLLPTISFYFKCLLVMLPCILKQGAACTPNHPWRRDSPLCVPSLCFLLFAGPLGGVARVKW